ncbi:DinB family protein [Aestuariivivens insulae]|uniref:DinB family protein n=1 Tax=Aestuariivivens insulae TaxID=1621988 RepID=UPI001F59861D|nr:DinB family protein [Aestuariivivens insulae]
MERGKALANRLKEVLLDGQWIANTNYKVQIENVNLKEATQKIGSLNSIAALTYHINYYLEGLLHVFKGGKLEIRDKYSFDMSPIVSEKDWTNLVEAFLFNAKLFVIEVSKMSDSKLDEPFVDEKYGTYQRNIEGVIEHSYYHLGQISLIKKMIS